MKNSFKTLAFILVALMLANCRETTKFYANTLRSDVFVQTYEENRYDFLWVFDNSGSMKERRDFVKDNLQGFLNVLNSRKAIDYQMAITTTDMFTDQGKLITNPAGTVKVIKSSSSNPVADFASVINNVQDSATSFWEQGLESSYQAVYQHGSEFMREGVPLVIVYLTDSEDWSCKDDCYGVEPEHNTNWKQWEMDRYITYFKNVKLAENTDVFVFPIIGMNTDDCSVEFAGNRYKTLTDALKGDNLKYSGKYASICNSVLKTSYNGIAQAIADRANKFPLGNKASGQGIAVYVDGTLIPYSPENYLFEESTNSIVFTGAAPKKDAIIEVTYSQLTH